MCLDHDDKNVASDATQCRIEQYLDLYDDALARHKVVDHWRRQASDHRRVEAATQQAEGRARELANSDAWDAVLDATLAHQTLAKLSADHRAALTLRYLDALPVGEIAHHLGRTIGATEALLTRAKAAFVRT